MPTLQEILAQNDPDALRKLLGRTSSSTDDSQIENTSPDAIPAPGPTPLVPFQPSPAPTSGMGPLANPADYKPSIIPKKTYVTESESPSSMTPDQRGLPAPSIAPSSPKQEEPSLTSVSPVQGFTDNTVAGLKTAQEESNRLKNQVDLQNAATTLAAAAAGAHGSTVSNLPELLKQGELRKKDAEDVVTQYQERGAQEKNDPKSAASVQARQLAKAMLNQAGINIAIPDNVSAADLEKRFPQFQHLATNKENIAARKEIADLKRQEIAAGREGSADTREKMIAARGLQQAARQVQTAGGTRGNQLRTSLDQANRIFSTMGIDPEFTAKDVENLETEKLDKKNKLQIVEGAIELNKLLSGAGIPAQATLQKLVPSNVKMDAGNIMDYMSSELNPRDQGKFLKDILKITARARDYAKTENTKLSQGVVSSLALAKKHYSDEYKDFLRSNNLMDTGDYLQGKDSQVSIKSESKQDPKIADYAKQHGLDYDKAKTILVNRGYQPSEK